MTALQWLAVAVSAVWCGAAWRRRGAWPVAVALTLSTAVDLARQAGLRGRVDLALLLAQPVVSAWCVMEVLRCARA